MNLQTKILCAIITGLLIGLAVTYFASADNAVPNVISWQRNAGAECVTDYRIDGAFTVCQCPCDLEKDFHKHHNKKSQTDL